ncbi:MAG: hypothetical protein U0794_14885 [Isosphaeraceae bacterium]
MVIHRLEGEVRDFKLKRSSIRSIEYFEDMLMAEADRLVLAKDFTRAFECLMRVRSRDSAWKGLDEHVNRLLFAEGSEALLGNEAERGLRLLGELAARKPDYPGLAERLAESYGGRARKAFELGLFALGRKILHDAEPLAPNHPELKAIRTQFVDRARGRFDAARSLANADRLDALTERFASGRPSKGERPLTGSRSPPGRRSMWRCSTCPPKWARGFAVRATSEFHDSSIDRFFRVTTRPHCRARHPTSSQRR